MDKFNPTILILLVVVVVVVVIIILAKKTQLMIEASCGLAGQVSGLSDD